MLTPAQVKANFRQRGLTITQWAKDNNYRRHKVCLVLNGQSKALWGQGHEIAVALGLKDPAPIDTAHAA